MRARLLVIPLLLLGCDPNARDDLARVEQPTLEGAYADDVFGQPSLTIGTEPTSVNAQTTHLPAAVATDVKPFPGAQAMVWVADRDAHRVLGFDASSSPRTAWWLFGQPSWADRSPNGGGSVGSNTLNTPSAVAFMGNSELAIADTDNHRVLLVQPLAGMTVQAVFGQGNAVDTADRNKGGAITADTLAEPAGVAFDPIETARLIVADTGNHRVLIFAPMTTDGEPISTTAKVCIGQEDCTHGLPNRGGAVSRSTLNEPRGVATWNQLDALRGFYVADTGNHRVLHFPIHSSLPDLVYGQEDDFTTATPTKGGPSARSLRSPTGVAVDQDGSLWIADTGHHRVLHFPKGKTVADRVLGQPNMTSVAPPTAADEFRLRAPEGVTTSFTDVFVADTAHSRVLRYKRPCDDASCNDGNPCTDDRCGPTGCTHQTVAYPKECRGQLCAKDACLSCSPTVQCQPGFQYECINGACAIRCGAGVRCPSGHCVDGFCCDRACDGPCESCAQPGALGRCTVADGPPPTGRFCSAASQCGGRCNGVDGSRCYDAREGESCGIHACVDGIATAPGTCRADGTCSGKRQTCAPYACDVGGCHTSCRWDFECSADATCVSGVCVAGPGATAAGGCAYGATPGAKFALIALALVIAARRRK